MELLLPEIPLVELVASAYTYEEYKQFTQRLIEEGRTTGEDQSEAMQEYTRMNLQRMNRWDKTALVSESLKAKIQAISQPQTWLIFTEPWCGDAAQTMPYIVKAASYNQKISIKILLRDENPDWMDYLFGKNVRGIPKLVAFDEEFKEELFQWGPRPRVLQEMFLDYKKDPKGVSFEKFVESVHLWYAKDKNCNLDAELIDLL